MRHNSAHLEVAVRIEEEIRGLEVAMEDISRMECLEGTKGLVNEILTVIIAERLGSDNTVKVSFH